MPSPSSTTQRPDLGRNAWKFQDQLARERFIGDKLMPLMDVPEQSAEFSKMPSDEWNKLAETKRGNTGTYGRDDFDFDTDNYSTQEHGLEGLLSDKEARLYRRFWDLEDVVTRRKTYQLALAQEKRVADLLFADNATTFSGQITAVGNAWDTAGGTPLADVNAARSLVRDRVGMLPDTLVIGWDMYLDLGASAEIIDRIKYVSNAVVNGYLSLQVLAQYFEVRQVLIGDALYDAADKGQSATITEMWDPDIALLCVVSDGTSGAGANDVMAPGIGKQFVWTGDSGALTVEGYREENRRAGVVRVRQDITEKIIYKEFGQIMTGLDT